MTLAVGVAAITCLPGLGYQPLSWNEAVTSSAANRSLPHLFGLLSHTDAPLGAYYFLMHLWVRVPLLIGLHSTDAWLRLPSALCAVAAVAMTVLLASRCFGPRVGTLAGVLLAVHPLFVFYAYDARPYGIVTLLTLVSTWQFIRTREQPTAGRLTAYALVATVTLYMHLFTALVLVAHGITLFRRPLHLWRWLVTWTVVGVAAVPLAWFAMGQTSEIGWIPRASGSWIAGVFEKLGGSLAMLIPLAALSILGARLLFRKPLGKRKLLIVAWAALPPVLLLAANFVHPMLVARYLLPVVPATLIAAAVVAVRTRGRLATTLIAVAVAAGLITSIVQQTQPYKYENLLRADDMITDTAKAGDGILFVSQSFRVGYEQYIAGESDDAGPVVQDLAIQPGRDIVRTDQIGGVELAPSALRKNLVGHDRIYLFGFDLSQAVRTRHSLKDVAKEQVLQQSYRPLWKHRYGGVTVTLFTRSR
jgi:mannosyltransferase